MERLLCLGVVLAAFTGRAGTLAQFRTVFGDIEVELFDRDKPATVQNFIRYVQNGLYQDGFIHRCEPTFVIQGGGFWVANRSGTSPTIVQVSTFPTIVNEYTNGAIYGNLYGTIAMARRGGVTNSATSQWFFNLGNNSVLDSVDGGFTVFGRVVRGTNVLNVFRTFSASPSATTNLIRDYRLILGDAFGELPLLTPNATYNDLLYVDVSLLNVRVRRLTNDTCRIAWTSVAGKTNRVEYANKVPPANWNLLVATNGTGATLNVTDSSTNAARRFYRVRVEY
jgi:cyclophilin family peptidyl-prolyl cis-trans isomerase